MYIFFFVVGVIWIVIGSYLISSSRIWLIFFLVRVYYVFFLYFVLMIIL